jgi:geranylgeranyl diphosphate synthase type II
LTIFKKLSPIIVDIKEEIYQTISRDFPFSLKTPIEYFFKFPGKLLRPLLLVLSCKSVGGSFKDTYPAAAGIEIFHNFTLIHDDIMDQDDLRRGRETIHKKWGEGAAILVGDMLVGLAYEKMMECDSKYTKNILYLFNETYLKLCEGQALDKEFEERDLVSLNDYLDMISKKTAWLFKFSCQVGAILGGATSNQINLMRDFGNALGLGFQIQDDLLDFIGEQEALGKEVGSDLRMNKKTFVTLTYDKFISMNQKYRSIYPSNIWQFKTIQDLRSALFEMGLVNHVQQQVDEYLLKATNLLKKIQPLDDGNDLYQIILTLKNRQY